MKRLLLVAFLLALAFAAEAQSANTASLSWTAPTTNVDGTPVTLPITYNVYQGPIGSTSKVKIGSPSTTSFVVASGLANNTQYCWNVTAVVDGMESAMSNEACKTFPKATPKAPSALIAN